MLLRFFSGEAGILRACRKRSDDEMKKSTGFLLGIGAGLAAGAAAGMMAPHSSRQAMKNQVGQGMHKLGAAMDEAGDNLASGMR